MSQAAAGAVMVTALALAMWPAPGSALARVAPLRRKVLPAGLVHGEPGWLGRWLARRRDRGPDPFEVAAAIDLFAVCLRSGLPVGVAAAVAADYSPPPLAGPLARAAELLTLGADPAQAWACSPDDGADEHFRELAVLARRASRAGASLADGVAALADATRDAAQTQALARAERAGVAISGPLGLCFLPAFVCLGIVPVVIGLAGSMLGQW